MSGAVPATSGDMKSSLPTALPIRKPGDPVPSKAYAPSVLSASSASNPLAGRLDLIAPFSFKGRIRGFAQKYDISLTYAIGCIALPLILGVGLILFGKTAAMALAGKAVLSATAGALAYKLWYFPTPEVFSAIKKGQKTNDYAWLIWLLHANQGNMAFFTKQVSCPDCSFKGTPRELAISIQDPIAQALIEGAHNKPSAVGASAAAARKQKNKQ